MAKIITSAYLNKKLTGDQLRNKVGNVQINSGNSSKSLSGVGLKKFITKLGGKTDTQIEKMLKDKYGVSGGQLKKRESIMKLIRGDENKGGLTEEQIKRNLKLGMQKDDSGLKRRSMYDTEYAGGKVRTSGFVKTEVRTKGVMKNLKVGEDIKVGFAQDHKSDELPKSPASNMPPAGTRPIGL